MTNNEFSDSFDTLLNSYNTQAQFGEGASKQEITLDEYEKSVLLTQAQDIIIKSYFNARLNAAGEGMDDSERRQVDFSSLITKRTFKGATSIVEFTHITDRDENSFIRVIADALDDTTHLRLYLGKDLPNDRDFTEAEIAAWNSTHTNMQYIIRLPESGVSNSIEIYLRIYSVALNLSDWWLNAAEIRKAISTYGFDIEMGSIVPLAVFYEDNFVFDNSFSITSCYDLRGIKFELPSDILFILNENMVIIDEDNRRSTFVVKPINYREYDREMSKAYAQPLKKQMWRIFNNTVTGYDIQSEVIPREDISEKIRGSVWDYFYKVRYIRRPSPIVLTDLPNGLTIDGVSDATECTLNPILHVDILTKAVELALQTRGARPASQRKNTEE